MDIKEILIDYRHINVEKYWSDVLTLSIVRIYFLTCHVAGAPVTECVQTAGWKTVGNMGMGVWRVEGREWEREAVIWD